LSSLSILELTDTPHLAAFVGFRPLQHVSTLVQGVQEFKEIFQPATLEKFLAVTTSSPSEAQSKAALRSLFYEAVNIPAAKVKDLTQRLSARLEKEGAQAVFGAANLYQAEGAANGFRETEADAIARTWKISVSSYGVSDPGSLAASALMNLLRLEKGEGAWIQADDLHAYVEGDIIECMDNADGMVRLLPCSPLSDPLTFSLP
jgi:mannose-6-phosphate isomerase